MVQKKVQKLIGSLKGTGPSVFRNGGDDGETSQMCGMRLALVTIVSVSTRSFNQGGSGTASVDRCLTTWKICAQLVQRCPPVAMRGCSVIRSMQCFFTYCMHAGSSDHSKEQDSYSASGVNLG